jgi:ABC-type glycerol-3-phosphate transport system substrate-binding protein
MSHKLCARRVPRPQIQSPNGFDVNEHAGRVQFVGIPEFQAIGTVVGQNIAAALAGTMPVEQALKSSQATTERAVKQGGYLK